MRNEEIMYQAEYLKWRNSECGAEVAKFAHEAVNQVIESNFEDMEVCRPQNMHVTLGLLGAMLPVPMGNILRSLSQYYYDNPDEAAKAWDSIKPAMDPLNKRGWLG